jgi:hypothetical protein
VPHGIRPGQPYGLTDNRLSYLILHEMAGRSGRDACQASSGGPRRLGDEDLKNSACVAVELVPHSEGLPMKLIAARRNDSLRARWLSDHRKAARFDIRSSIQGNSFQTHTLPEVQLVNCNENPKPEAGMQ